MQKIITKSLFCSVRALAMRLEHNVLCDSYCEQALNAYNHIQRLYSEKPKIYSSCRGFFRNVLVLPFCEWFNNCLDDDFVECFNNNAYNQVGALVAADDLLCYLPTDDYYYLLDRFSQTAAWTAEDEYLISG